MLNIWNFLKEEDSSYKNSKKQRVSSSAETAFESERFSPIGYKRKFFIPTAQDPSNKSIKGYEVFILRKDKEVAIFIASKALLQGINAQEYYILFDCLLRLISQKEPSPDLINFLIGITVLAGNRLSGTTTWRSFSKKLISFLDREAKADKNQEESIRLFLLLVRKFLVKNLEQSKYYYQVSSEITKYFMPSKEVRRIGVGYKDKGSLSPGHVTKDVPDSWQPPKEDTLKFASSILDVVKEYPFFEKFL